MFTALKPTLASLPVRTVHFGENGRPVNGQVEAPVKGLSQGRGIIVTESVVPVSGIWSVPRIAEIRE